jgi:hypothetical protein
MVSCGCVIAVLCRGCAHSALTEAAKHVLASKETKGAVGGPCGLGRAAGANPGPGFADAGTVSPWGFETPQ